MLILCLGLIQILFFFFAAYANFYHECGTQSDKVFPAQVKIQLGVFTIIKSLTRPSESIGCNLQRWRLRNVEIHYS